MYKRMNKREIVFNILMALVVVMFLSESLYLLVLYKGLSIKNVITLGMVIMVLVKPLMKWLYESMEE